MTQSTVTKFAKVVLVVSTVLLTFSLMAAHHQHMMHHRGEFHEEHHRFGGRHHHHRFSHSISHSNSHSNSIPEPEPEVMIPERDMVPERNMMAQERRPEMADEEPKRERHPRHPEEPREESMRHREFPQPGKHDDMRKDRKEPREGMRHREEHHKKEHRNGPRHHGFPRRQHEEGKPHENHHGPHHFCFGLLILSGVAGLVAGFTERRCAATVFAVLIVLGGVSAIAQHGRMVHHRMGECRMESEFQVSDRAVYMPEKPAQMPEGVESRQAMPKIMIDTAPAPKDCRPHRRDVAASIILVVLTITATVLAVGFRRKIVAQALSQGYAPVVVEGAVLDEAAEQKTVCEA